jgi:putative DNA primase/helicase
LLRARFMRNDFFEFTMTHKHVIVGNYKPRLRGGDAAMARRMLLVPFNARFKGDARDPLMLEKLMGEGPAILHWMMRGAVEWASEGLAVPSSVRRASDEYMADHDDLTLWMDECCVREPEAQDRASHLYQCFSAWKAARGELATSMTAWGSRMGAVPGVSKRQSNGVWYTGIRISREHGHAAM